MQPVTEQHLSGVLLYGDDFSESDLAEWFEAEKQGYYNLYGERSADSEHRYEYALLNAHYGYSNVLGRQFDTCLALGCADGSDVEPIAEQVSKFVAVEPATEWWRDQIGGRPAKFMLPSQTGVLSLADASVDLITCFGVLHHIPNVTFVIAELCRVLKPGGLMLLREPMSSMGDFRKKRHGCTPFERGIAPAYLAECLRKAGIDNVEMTPVMFAPLMKLWTMLTGKNIVENSVGIYLDKISSRFFMWNSRYWRPRVIDKIAPSSMFVVARKHGAIK